MRVLLQIILLLTCFNSSAFSFAAGNAPKIVAPTNNTLTFQQTEHETRIEKAKIGIENFARSSIEEQEEKTTTFHRNTCSLSNYLKEVNSCVIDFQKTDSKSEFKVAPDG